MLTLLCITIALAWGLNQFRPHRRGVWASRWEVYWFPLLLAVQAMLKMTWQGFVRDPAVRLWRRRAASRESRTSLDAAIDKMLGRD